MVLGSAQPLTEMSARDSSWGHKRSVFRADSLTTYMCRCPGNLRTLTSCRPVQFCNVIVLAFVRLLVGKPEGKKPLGRPRRRWEDNIKMELQEVEGGFVGTGWSWLRLGTGGGHLWVR
jgi:hypothetical protein